MTWEKTFSEYIPPKLVRGDVVHVLASRYSMAIEAAQRILATTKSEDNDCDGTWGAYIRAAKEINELAEDLDIYGPFAEIVQSKFGYDVGDEWFSASMPANGQVMK